MSKRIRLIVNALPLTHISTGISRYLKCLYTRMEALFGAELEVGYFDGRSVRGNLPSGPTHLEAWSRMAALFWRTPLLAALAVRIGLQLWQEVLFRGCAKGYDLYHDAAFFPFAPVSGVRTIFTIQDLSLLRFPQYHPRERVLFHRLFFKRRCKKVNTFLAISAFTGREVQTHLGVDGAHLRVTPLAHDAGVFYRRSQYHIAEFRRRLSLPSEYFLFVGTGDPRKNAIIIPRALRHSGLGIPLVTAGWGGWSDDVDQAKDLIPLGYLSDEDLARLYSGALALVFPSLYEGFGLPILEAMACGCPVICSRKASLPEVAGDAAVYLDDPHSIGELAQVLKDVALNQDLRRDLVRKGAEQASRFSWDITAMATFGVFRELAR